MRLDKEKAAEALVYIAGKVKGISIMEILKVLYFAELSHLAKYGRTITGDRYVAMEFGPVGSEIYNALKAVRNPKNSQPLSDLAGRIKVVDENKTPIVYLTGNFDPDLDFFSETDLECLDKSISENGDRQAATLSAMSHGLAWQEAWDARGEKKAHPMNILSMAKEMGASEGMMKFLEEQVAFSLV